MTRPDRGSRRAAGSGWPADGGVAGGWPGAEPSLGVGAVTY
jgi:hypothetical protein